MRIPALRLFLCTSLLATAAAGSDAPLLDPADYGHFQRRATTRSPEAQRWFNQGLALAYSFDHDNAIRSFQEATKLDPEFALAWWGIAHAAGMHINLPILTPDRNALAREALGHAQRHAAKATPVERALIAAQAKRYAEQVPTDLGPLNNAHAEAMRAVWKEFPRDADVGVLFVESLMNLRPWDYWKPDGSPHPTTVEAIAALDRVLELNPDHPQALHLYIHAVEASPDPARAIPMADRLRRLQPGLGHMVHMPSHIDVITGSWAESIQANERAVVSDRETRGRFGTPPGFLWLYMGHNRHMLAFGAMMSGRGQLAQKHIADLMAELPLQTSWAKDWGFVADYFAPMQLEVLVRFGRWDEILAAGEPPANQPITRTLRHGARAIAFAAKGDTTSARAEQAKFVAARAAIPAEAYYGNSGHVAVLATAEAMIDGEILIFEGRRDEGIARLREAVALEDKLRYNEPPDWIIPVRHTLGAALLNSGRFREAEQVYREDLKKWPNNGWSLFGLARALKHLGRADEAKQVEAQFARVWAQADTDITSSCLCQPFANEPVKTAAAR
ncbi:MAG TPA: tetratricopeptide repeat protein [Opitutaceae bacterium]|nr:tetratricopeptide repeat protein [Opitutaceae bacterium]